MEPQSIKNRSKSGQQKCPTLVHRLLTPVVYDELRRCARRALRQEWRAPSVDATDLVHEVVLQLIKTLRIDLANPEHLVALCKRGMTQWLIEHARRRETEKRGGGHPPNSPNSLPLAEEIAWPDSHATVNQEINDAIDRLIAE